MKLLSEIPSRRRAAFTFLEMMFSVGIYAMLIIGTLIAIQIFALRVYTLAATKLTATQGCREALNQIRDDIREGKEIQVGNMTGGTFTPFTGTNLAIGNALQVYEATNLGPPFSIYYLQTNSPGGVSSNNLMWIYVASTNSVTNVVNLASYITNMNVFSAETWNSWPTNSNVAGWATPTVTNSIYNNQVYCVLLQFYQWEYPIAMVSATNAANAYDYYQLRTRVCRRAID